MYTLLGNKIFFFQKIKHADVISMDESYQNPDHILK